MIEMTVFGLALDEDSQAPVLVLKDKEEKKHLPIWIGAMEAMAISLALNDVKLPRPMTHDLMIGALGALGVRVVGVEVVALKEGTYFAEIVLDQGGKTVRVDSRPSDGVALALRAACPISVAEDVLEAASQAPKPAPETVIKSEDAEQWGDLLEKLEVDNKYKM